MIQTNWHLFPCYGIKWGKCTCNKICGSPGKHPKTRHGVLDATTDKEQIKKWWTDDPFANIAVRTGIDFWVLDVDDPQNFNHHFQTLKSFTPNGHHFFFKNVPGIRNRSFKYFDVRGINGYVILPPSNHYVGEQYVWANNESIADAPQWLIDIVLSW